MFLNVVKKLALARQRCGYSGKTTFPGRENGHFWRFWPFFAMSCSVDRKVCTVQSWNLDMIIIRRFSNTDVIGIILNNCKHGQILDQKSQTSPQFSDFWWFSSNYRKTATVGALEHSAIDFLGNFRLVWLIFRLIIANLYVRNPS